MATKKSVKASKKSLTKKVASKKAVSKKKQPTQKVNGKKSISTKNKAVTPKPAVKKSVKKTAAPVNSSMSIKSSSTKVTLKKIDYFKLPFEVYYSQCLDVIQYEFKSDKKTKKFSDVKAVHMEQGRSWGTLFFCENNKGPELYCCLKNQHDEVEPGWLLFQEEENIRFNYGCDFAVQIEGDEIKFVSLTDEQKDEDSEKYLDVDNMDYCCSHAFMAYEIGQSCPDYIILDADSSRIKIDLNGYELDEGGNRIEFRRIINTDDLDFEEYSDCDSSELWDAKFAWVKSILEKDFPKEKHLRLSWSTQ